MKKIAILSLVLAAAFAVTPAFAFFPMQMPSNITVANLNAGTTVMNNVGVKADTGDNEIKGSGMIITGEAGAYSYVGNDVNSTRTIVSGVCGNCMGNVSVLGANLNTSVMNNVGVKADTGDNEIGTSRRSRTMSGGMIITGDAGAQSEVVNVVNSSVTRVRLLGGIR